MISENGAVDDVTRPLFETARRGSYAYKAFAGSIFLAIILALFFRLTNIPEESGRRWAWICMFLSEALFSFYWIINQSVRWNVVRRIPFKNRLSTRYEDKLPEVDVFVCTADPVIEPPTLVVNTVLSVMSYNYPTEKLSIYLSDDGCSEFTFYALLEARDFAKCWIPFCKKFNVEPRAPSAYFKMILDGDKSSFFAQEWSKVKKLYEDMNMRIEAVVKKRGIPPEIKEKHKGFSEWNSKIAKNDHQSIVQIVNDGKDSKYLDVDGNKLPRLVYLSREKRPGRPHNFKAGSMNALIRVSSRISNAPIILNVDCDMYSNDPDSIRDALCFFMDEKQGHEVSYVQFPQRYHNIDKNDIYHSVACVTHQKELAGLDGYRGALYCGTGCFHRRASLSGMKFSEGEFAEMISSPINTTQGEELEKSSKLLADCSYEDGTEWGKQMGLVYGCPVEDIVTGLSIQCRGWKPIYYNPPKHAFLGIAATTLDQALIQHKRWSEGLFQIFLSKYCPFIYGHGKIPLGAQMGYCVYLLWAPISLSTLCYAVLPPLCLIHGIQLFPQDFDPYEENPGTGPFSEPESQFMRKLAMSFEPHIWVNVHSGMEALFMPYDHKNTTPSGAPSQKMRSMLQKMNRLHLGDRCLIGSGGGSVGYLAHGTATDYMYDVARIPMAFTFEIYGDPAASSKDCFRMFNPMDITTFNKVLNDWSAAFFEMFKSGELQLDGLHSGTISSSFDKLISIDDYLNGYLMERRNQYGKKMEVI